MVAGARRSGTSSRTTASASRSGQAQQLSSPAQADGVGQIVGQDKIVPRLEIGGRGDLRIGQPASTSICGGRA